MPAFGVNGITSQNLCTGYMEPFPFPIDAHASLIKMDHRRINHLPFDLLFHRLQNFVGGPVRINQGSLTQLMAKEVSEQLTAEFVGQKLVLAQKDGRSKT